MPKDYRKPRDTRRKRTNNRPKNKTSHGLLHTPSFIFGGLVGAALVLLGAYGPELLEESWLKVSPQAVAREDAPTEPEVTFKFPELLKDADWESDTTPYSADLPANQSDTPSEYLIQAASFRDPDDAETLRAELLLQDFPVSMSRVALADGNWYRVTVGPFESATGAQRAITKLRSQALNAILIKRQT